jgi:hypothetical protein
MRPAAIILFIIASLSSCRTPKIITETVTVRETVTETVHDTTIVVEKDNSAIRALLECDEERNVLVKKLVDVRAGERVHPPALKIEDNILTAECEVDSFTIYLAWKDRFVETDTIKHTVLPPTIVKEPSGWQWFQIWLGRILVAVAIIFVALKAKKIIL